MIHKILDSMSFLKNKKAWILKYRVLAGTLLIILGIAGLFLPFLQGIALIVLGILVLNYNEKKIIKAK